MPISTTRRKKQILNDTKSKLYKNKSTAIASLPPPQPGPQSDFLNCNAKIVLYGGAAGGGKTMGELLDAAKPELLKLPGYGAVFLRRTYPQIRNEGGLWDESSKWYPAIAGKPIESKLKWKFPSGATIRFAHLQHEKNIYDWQGAQISRLYFDELTHFTKKQFFYLLSRGRTTIGVDVKVRATCNPDADSWVKDLVDWYLNDEGFPIPERSGVIRWFINFQDELFWSDTPDELRSRFPEIEPISFAFIPAKIQDNKILLKEDPGYLANLQAQHPVEQARLLYGNWKIKYESGKVFNRSWFNMIDIESVPNGKTIRFWDLAATTNQLSFYTAGVKIRRAGDSYFVLDAIAERVSPAEADQLILATANQDGINTMIRWELEGGSAGIRDGEHLRSHLKGFNAKPIKPQGDKIMRAKPFASLAYQGKVHLVKGLWNDQYINALHRFDGSSQPLVNDLTDASSGAFSELNQAIMMPDFS